MSQTSGNQSAELHVAQRRVRKMRRVGLAGLAGVLVGCGGGAVATAAGHKDLGRVGIAGGEAALVVEFVGLTGKTRQQLEVLRLSRGQEISGR